jgi:thiamine pyrophosphokinase
MRALIVANGELSDDERVPGDHLKAALVIAVDGGWRHCRDLGLQVDVVIGDLDSLRPAQLEESRARTSQIIPYPPEKDETDLELALLYAVERGATEVTVLAGLGGRIDMSLANISLLFHPDLNSVRIVFWHHGQRLWRIRPPGETISGQVGDTLSLIPFTGDASGIRTEQLAYPLNDEHLTFGQARGISNVFTGNLARIELESGTLVAVWTRGRA